MVLAAVAGGYRALLIERGDDADHAVVRTLVPVSTRHDEGRGVLDNRVSALLFELPVQTGGPDRTSRDRQDPDVRLEGIAHG